MKRDSQRGSVLLAVVLALSLVAAVALLLNRGGGMNLESSAGRETADVALAAAEAGLEHAIWFAQHSNCAGYADFTDQSFGSTGYQDAFSSVYTTSITPVAGSPVLVTARGMVQKNPTQRELSRQVRVYEPPVTVTLQPDGAEMEDTMIYEWKSTWNYGVDTQIGVDTYWADSKMRSLLKFDLSSMASSVRILSATLELYMKSPSDTGGPVGVHRVTTPWDEGTGSGGMAAGANWNVSASGVPWTTAGGDFDQDPVTMTDVTPYTPGWNGWDITSLVHDWVSGISPNHGLMLEIHASGRAAYFHSSDYSNPALRPKLTITYACECGSETSESLPLQPGAEGLDSYVQNRNNDSQHGLQEDLFIDNAEGSASANHTLLNFDLSTLPAGVLINSAELSLYAFDVDTAAGGTDITAHRLLEPWVETEVTYQYADSSTAWTWPANFDAAPAATSTLFKDNLGWHAWDLTNLVIQWSTGVAPNNGLVLLGTSDLYWSAFHSSDYSDPALHPKLTINYSCPCGVDCTPLSELPCDADFTPDTEVAQFSTVPYSGAKAPSLTYLPEGMVFNGVTSPAGGAWIILDSNLKLFQMTDMNGSLLTNGNVPEIKAPSTGITLVTSGSFAGHLAFLDNILLNLTYAPLDLGATTSLSVSAFSSSPMGLDFIAETSSGTYNERLAFLDSGAATVFIITQTGVVETSFSIDAGPASPVDVKHLPTTDKLLVSYGGAGNNLARIYDMNGTLLREYDMNPFASAVQSVVIHPPSCQHVMLDSDLEVLKYLDVGVGGGGGGSSTMTLNSVKDTWLEQATDNKYGSEIWMHTGLDVNENMQRTMVEFDIASIPAGATVLSATLRLYVENKQGVIDSNIGLYRIVTDWDESTVTWNSSSGGGFDPASLEEPLVEWSEGWKEWAVPPGLIHEWIDTVTPNYGLLLDYLNTKKKHILRFATREHTDPSHHPQLVIEYTEP